MPLSKSVKYLCLERFFLSYGANTNTISNPFCAPFEHCHSWLVCIERAGLNPSTQAYNGPSPMPYSSTPYRVTLLDRWRLK